MSQTSSSTRFIQKAARLLVPSIYAKYMSYVLRIEALEKALVTMATDDLWQEGEEGALNGQMKRREVVDDLFEACRFRAVIETGCWIGSSTGYFRDRFDVEVHTCELSRVFCAVAKHRLRQLDRILFHLGDSASVLPGLLASNQPDGPIFFYLDAHWQEDLPLAEEVRTISKLVRDWVALVDDFEVPGDEGYEFDDYGPSKRLTLADFQSVFSEHQLGVFFPKASSDAETGRKRGYVVLSSQGEMTARLASLKNLTPV